MRWGGGQSSCWRRRFSREPAEGLSSAQKLRCYLRNESGFFLGESPGDSLVTESYRCTLRIESSALSVEAGPFLYLPGLRKPTAALRGEKQPQDEQAGEC